MDRRIFRLGLLSLSLALAACGGGDDGRADPEEAAVSDSAAVTPGAPAGQSVAPDPGSGAEEAPLPPGEGQLTQPPADRGQTYESCMAGAAKAGSADEREILERTCRVLPGAPKR